MNIYVCCITVDADRPWIIKNVTDYQSSDIRETYDKKYYIVNRLSTYYKGDVNNGVKKIFGKDEELDDYICFMIAKTFEDNETIDKELYKKKVKDAYKNELKMIINNCQNRIDKLES